MISEEEINDIYDVIAEQMRRGESLPKNIIKEAIKKYCDLDDKVLDAIIFTVSVLFAMKIHEWCPTAISFMHEALAEIKKRMKNTGIEIA